MSQNLGGFKEQIAPPAFNRSASQGWPDVQARYNHDDNMLLGTTGGNSLRLHVDEVGLIYDVDMLDDQVSQRIYELVQRGDVRQSSFAFIADQDDWTTDDTGFPMRTLHQVRLIDVAPVNSPAYLDTFRGASVAREEVRRTCGGCPQDGRGQPTDQVLQAHRQRH
jgi:HK97 family phage prohead protease